MNQIKHDSGATPGAWSDTSLSRWLWLAPTIALLVAILPLPYPYYILLRWLVAGTAGFLAWKEYDGNNQVMGAYSWTFGAIALLYNPLIPIHLFKMAWVLINLATLVVFIRHYRLRYSGF